MLTPINRILIARARARLSDPREWQTSIAALADDAGMSPYQFIRLFRRVFGDTPHRFRIRARLDRARWLLATDRGSVTDVCMEVGYDSLGSFSTAFTRHFGEPPSTCRRRFVACGDARLTSPQTLIPGCFGLMGGPALIRNFREAVSGNVCDAPGTATRERRPCGSS
ncbi:helix-turn-helix domain-containing protein [Arhodomonas sp. AD133]|uniref:helix-turn-helix domain-containing protein n=1 Tax=Arhodomonas sp. AD133 TaxID=3415009 RepID=UPI003EBB849D